jgi:hypothetical protein
MDSLVLLLSTQCCPYQTGSLHQLSPSSDQSGQWLLEVSFTRNIVKRKVITRKLFQVSFFLSRLYIGSFFLQKSWALYTCSALLGFGAALIWTGMGDLVNFYFAHFPSSTLLIHINYLELKLANIYVSTGQGNYLTLNSDGNNISRNSGVFWAVFQCRWVSKSI